MYLAYRARKRDFWLRFGRPLLGGIDPLVVGVNPGSFDLPLAELVGVPTLGLGDLSDSGPREEVEGRKRAAQRSYSLQSK